VDRSRCVELFCDDTAVHADERIEFRCDECHAEGAMKNTTLTKEVRDRMITEADGKRDLFFTAGKPTAKPDIGEDARILAVDLKRSKLSASQTIKQALSGIRPK